MSTAPDSSGAPRQYRPLQQLILARLREFYREPEAVFWVYGFPILMVITLGIAFRNKPLERIAVDVEAGPAASRIVDALASHPRFTTATHDAATCRRNLRTGRTDLIVAALPGPSPTKPGSSPTKMRQEPRPARYEYFYNPSRPESVLARNAVDDVLQRAAGRSDPAQIIDHEFNEPGGRYVDFLVPGLLGMSLMGGGLFGIGFVTVDMRIRKLLKRFLATPMRKSHFLAGIMVSRLLFMIPEVLVQLVFARLAFGVVIYGNLLSVCFLIFLGACCFAGIGLLVASRARTLETVSGLLNFVQLPMWVLSGIFFSSDRFPGAMQPIIKLLPLTLLIDALRAVMLEGASLASQGTKIGALATWATLSFLLALRWFRWN